MPNNLGMKYVVEIWECVNKIYQLTAQYAYVPYVFDSDLFFMIMVLVINYDRIIFKIWFGGNYIITNYIITWFCSALVWFVDIAGRWKNQVLHLSHPWKMRE